MSEEKRKLEYPHEGDILDPLENVIEGRTPMERYKNFVGVLGMIWPYGQESGDFGADFWRARRVAGGNVSATLLFNPRAIAPEDLEEDEFKTLLKHLGTPDYLRVRTVPPHLLDEGVRVIPVGGSCVVETFGMRTMNELKTLVEKGELPREQMAQYARRYLRMAPTWTQISGAVLSGQDVTVHLWETDMWAQRLESWGIPQEEALQEVYTAYEKINDAVTRRARLINPNAQVIAVNFDELDLVNGVTDWFASMGMKWDRKFRIAEVIFTYIGDTMLEKLLNALRQRLNEARMSDPQIAAAISKLLDGNCAVRMKQVDHNTWDSMAIPWEVVTGVRDFTPEEQERLKTSQEFRYALGIARWALTHFSMEGRLPTAVVGFIDPPFGTRIAHKDREMGIPLRGKPGTPDYYASHDRLLNNPRRLHAENFNAHFELLEQFTVDHDSERQQIIEKKNQLVAIKSEIDRQLRELQRLNQQIQDKLNNLAESIRKAEAIVSLINNLLMGQVDGLENEENRMALDEIIDRINTTLESIQRREDDKKELTKLDLKDKEELGHLREALIKGKEEGRMDLTESDRHRLGSLRLQYIQLIEEAEKRRETLEQQYKENQNRIASIAGQHNLASLIKDLEDLTQTINILSSFNPFPLNENPFVMHAMQFLFDPDFVYFLLAAVRVQENRVRKVIDKREANAQMRALMRKIYPKLRAYYEYIYGRRNDLSIVRNMRVLW